MIVYMLGLFLIVLAYLVGSIQPGIIIGKIRGVNIREVGSGGTGTTNVLRTLGWFSAGITLLADLGKAVLVILLAHWLNQPPLVEALCGFVVLIGHSWPIYHQFRGGKTVASSLGMALVLVPVPTVIGLIVGLAVMAIWRYVSLGSMVGVSVVFLATSFLSGPFEIPREYVTLFFVTAILVLFRHRENIERLLGGTESKIGQRFTS